MATTAPLDFTNSSPHSGASLDGRLVQVTTHLVAPTATDDSAIFYFVGHMWINQATSTWYRLDNDAIGSAVWTAIGVSGILDMPVIAKTAAYTVTVLDKGKQIDCTNTFTITELAAATAGDGFTITYRNSGTGVITTSITGLTLAPNESVLLTCDGTNYKIVASNGLNSVIHQRSDLVAGTATIPIDDTIPQITEGYEVLTKAITVTAGSRIVVDVNLVASITAINETITCALFLDGAANAVAATACVANNASYRGSGVLRYEFTAASTATLSFAVRIGANVSASRLNGHGGTAARIYGGVAMSSLVITEHK